MKTASGDDSNTPKESSRSFVEYVNPSLTELVEEASFRTVENSPDLLSIITELVRQGKSPEQVIDYFEQATGFERWRIAYLGCAASYIQKLNRVPVSGGVQ